ncbi:MAG: SpoIID/LytB domain-containing protein [Patescibacteria group bacterium]
MHLRHSYQFFVFSILIGLWSVPFSVMHAVAQPTALVTNAGASVMKLVPEQEKTLAFQFLNTGTTTWRASGATPIRFRFRGYGASFYHSSWVSQEIPTRLAETAVKPGAVGTFYVTVQAPPAEGHYLIVPYLILGSTIVQHDRIELDMQVEIPRPKPIVVTNQKPTSPPTGTVAGVSTASLLNQEPTIRVGLFVADVPVTITAESTMSISSEGNLFETAGPGTIITLRGVNARFTASLPNGAQYETTAPIRMEAVGGILDITSLEQRTEWNQNINDNRFHGVLELYYAANTQRYWMVNELPLEQYLKGLAETSQGAPPEYHKALSIATRTYALYHWYAKNKHGGHFDVDAKYDQVYRGYGVEQRLTDFGRAVDATRGMVATIGDDVVVTPYFSQSDGRTRAWSEVWSGRRPHLVSVPVPADQGKAMYGHGVGMSNMGAAAMAREGKTFEEILHYFYTGITLRRGYE